MNQNELNFKSSLLAARSMFQTWVQAGVDFLYPPHCLWCAEFIHNDSHFCKSCRDSLILHESTTRCQRCSAPVGPHLNTAENCIHCREDPYAFEYVVSLGPHDEELKHACLLAKSATSSLLTHALAVQLWGLLKVNSGRSQFDLIVPIPHHWTERLFRSQFPSEMAAQSLGQLSSISVSTNALRKVRKTPKQTDLTPTERRKNLRDAFRADIHLVSGKQILLVDDVLTTGTTAHQATKALLAAGASRVFVAVFSRGIGR